MLVAEGQPRNILASISNRFAGCCRVLSRRCHGVIHSCYVFYAVFFEIFMRIAPLHARSKREMASAGGVENSLSPVATGLTIGQRGRSHRARHGSHSSIQNHGAL